jgi:hypothetical protein
MSDLTVPTHFGDVSELSEGLVDRVDDQRLILYGPTPFEEGAQIGFQVLLLDGSPALEGTGRVAASIDGGEERPEETRYDIVLDGLEMGGSSEVVYERILLARDGEARGDPSTGEVNVEQLEQVSDETDGGAFDEEEEEATAAVDTGDPQMAEALEQAKTGGYEEPVAQESTQVGATAEGDAGPQEDFADVGSAEVESLGEQAPAEPEAEVDAAEVSSVPSEHPPAAEAEVADADGAPMEVESGEFEAEEPVAEPEAAAQSPASEPPPEHGQGPVESTAQVDLADVEDVSGGSEDEFGFGEPVEAVPATGSIRPVAGDASAPPSKAPPAPPEPPPGFHVGSMAADGGALMRPSRQPSWLPEAPPEPEPQASTGLFDYGGGGLPVPSAPPRPDLDPSLRVAPAPQPSGEGSMQGDAQAAPAVQPAPQEPTAEGAPAMDVESSSEPQAEPVSEVEADSAAEPEAPEAPQAQEVGVSEPPLDLDADDAVELEEEQTAHSVEMPEAASEAAQQPGGEEAEGGHPPSDPDRE